jgi:hypothetical protein
MTRRGRGGIARSSVLESADSAGCGETACRRQPPMAANRLKRSAPRSRRAGPLGHSAHIRPEKLWRHRRRRTHRLCRILDRGGCRIPRDARASTRKPRWTSDDGRRVGPSGVCCRRQSWWRAGRGADCRLPARSPRVGDRRAPCDRHVPGILEASQSMAGLVSVWDGGSVRGWRGSRRLPRDPAKDAWLSWTSGGRRGELASVGRRMSRTHHRPLCHGH